MHPSFFDLQSMLLVEENHAGASTSTHTDNRMLYTEGDRPRGCGGRSELVRNGGEIKEGGTEVTLTSTPDPPEIGGVKAIRTGKGKPS